MRGGEKPSEGAIEAELANSSCDASFADSFLGDEWASKLVCKLIGYPHKQTLDLRGNNIRAEGAKALADCLRTNRSLTSVCLEWNNIGLLNYGVNALAESLQANISLTKIDLRNNRISAEGGYALARAVKVNRTLTSIDLRWNDIGIQAGAAFIESLRLNQAIKECFLSGNNLGKHQLAEVEVAIRSAATPPLPPPSLPVSVGAGAGHSNNSNNSYNTEDNHRQGDSSVMLGIGAVGELREQMIERGRSLASDETIIEFEEREIEMLGSHKKALKALRQELELSARRVNELEQEMRQKGARVGELERQLTAETVLRESNGKLLKTVLCMSIVYAHVHHVHLVYGVW
jgi:hypothetical protein